MIINGIFIVVSFIGMAFCLLSYLRRKPRRCRDCKHCAFFARTHYQPVNCDMQNAWVNEAEIKRCSHYRRKGWKLWRSP